MTEDAPPHTYAAWLLLLDRFAAGEDGVFPALRAGSLAWTPVVAERFTRRLADVLAIRLHRITADLQRALDRAAGEPVAVAHALLAARRALVPLRALAALPCVPDTVRAMLAGEVTRFATQTQASLETAAARLRHTDGALLKVLRDTPLTAVAEPLGERTGAMGVPDGRPTRRGRRVLA